MKILEAIYNMAEGILSSFAALSSADIIGWMKTGESFAGSLQRMGADASFTVSRKSNVSAYLLQYIITSTNGAVPSAIGTLILPAMAMTMEPFITYELKISIDSASIKVTLMAVNVYCTFIFTEIID